MVSPYWDWCRVEYSSNNGFMRGNVPCIVLRKLALLHFYYEKVNHN